MPELNWPDFDDDVLYEILEAVCQGKSRLEEIEQADLVPFLQSRLTLAQSRELHESAPPTLSLPSARLARLVYESGRPPILAVRLQELFGWSETPRVARGRRARFVAYSRSEQPAGSNYERPEELLDDDLPPSEKRSPPPLSQTRVARGSVPRSSSDFPETAEVVAITRISPRILSIQAGINNPALIAQFARSS